MTPRLSAATVATLLALATSTAWGGLTDTLDFAVPASRDAHHLAATGQAAVETAGDLVGGHDERRPAEVVRGARSELSFDLAVERGKPVTLEFEELDGREHAVRGYLVYVDDAKRAFRTWEACGAGPLHYFVELPATDADHVHVRLVNQSDSSFALTRAWAFTGFQQYFADNHLGVPYRIAPTYWLTWDRDKDLQALRQIKDSMGRQPNVHPAFTTWIPYARLSEREAAEKIDYALDIARQLDLPVQICFDSWWGNTPEGPDGHGGLWMDVPYQQVVWDETHKRMQLSVPNHWGSTPWLTTANPVMNRMKYERVRAAAAHLAERYHQLRAEGKADLVLAVNLDNEPVYWASGNAGLGPDLLWADFNPAVVASAKADGVALDPRDGLSFDERRWLCTNLLRYNDLIGRAAVDGLGRDATIVTPDHASPSDNLLANNIYTQAMVSASHEQYPMLDWAYPFWETAAPASVHVGGEWNSDSLREREAVLHQVALGRNAAINAECGNNADHHAGVVPGYALGQRYYTPYNYPLDKMDVATQGLDDLGKPYPAPVYRRVLSDNRFRDQSWKTVVAGFENIQTKLIGNTPSIAATPADPAKPGILRYRIDVPKDGGLWVELNGRARDFAHHDPKVCLQVFAGPAGKVLKLVHTFANEGDIQPGEPVELSSAVTAGQPATVELRLNAMGLSPSVIDWVSVFRVRFTAGWPAEIRQGLQEKPETVQTAREHNLLVSWRADAEAAIAKLDVAGAAKARADCARGAYAEAYALANQAGCLRLPATFLVRGGGQLGPYPVRLEAVDKVTAVLKEVASDAVRLSLSGEKAGEAKVVVGGLQAGKKYVIDQAEGDWRIRLSEKGDAVANQRGQITATLVVHGPAEVKAPEVVRGMADALRPGQWVVQAYDGSGPQKLDVQGANVSRGDDLEVKDGKIAANHGRVVEGTVEEFKELTPYAMPSIKLQGEKSFVLDLAAPIHQAGQKDSMAKSTELGEIGIKAGEKVKVRVNPEMNRVFEVWRQ